ncbi:MAG: phospholipid carrier-dependent glycosyltransferase [Actinobacteria bacterium]|nr:MAG: phospholipid carrier-dependent glycosyltransferase [Actinomycetota bacterium]
MALLAVIAFAAGTRAFDLGAPCSSPCAHNSDHSLIFDESYYVNAARVIAGIHPPATAPYHDAPLGKDPNAEHPQLAKLVMAGGIEVFGDGPWGWRLGSLVFGLIAVAAMYALVRAAGGSSWLAAGASAVMALDNLMLVHGRIATLDVYALAPMLVACALYLRRRLLLAGLALALAASMKLVALYLLPVLLLIELIRFAIERPPRGRRVRPLAGRIRPFVVTAGAGIVALLLLLWLLDVAMPAYDPGSRTVYGGSPFPHVGHMLSYAAKLKSVPHATGISSSPWQWLLDQKPINYSRVAVNSLAGGKIVASHAIVSFRGEVNQFVIMARAGSGGDRRRRLVRRHVRPVRGRGRRLRPDLLPLLRADRAARGLSADDPAVRAPRDAGGRDDRLGGCARLQLRGSVPDPRLTSPPVRRPLNNHFSWSLDRVSNP